MGEKTFNLTWNNHLANLSGLFEGLYKSGSLTDTTLACQGGMLRAHRLVLAACSPYFERVFKEHYGDQPILILKGVAVEEMECLLDFMYRGSIDVAEEHLPSLIKTATDLEIRGLSADHKNESNNVSSKVDGRMPRCQIETRVQTTEHRRENASSESFDMKQESTEDQIKMEEIEDDPMVIEHDDSYDAPLSTAEEQIKHLPPPMFKRETRYKGQKRVSVGRSSKSNDSLEVRLRDRGSLRETIRGDTFEEGVSLNAVKQEPMFNNSCSDPTVPAIQLKEDFYDQEQESSESPSGGTNDSSKSSATGKKSEAGKRGGEGRGAKILSRPDKAQYKPFSCDLCTLAFTRASHLARHRRVHTGERPFACTLCPRMFARQDKLKQHLDSHLQWPKRRAFSGLSSGGNPGSTITGKGKRGRPRKISSEQSAMEEIMKFGEFSSLLNKSQPSNTVCNNELSIGCAEPEVEPDDEDAMLYKNSDSYGCQVENGQDVE